MNTEEKTILLDKTMSNRVERLTRDVASLEGRREALDQREVELINKISESKGRMSLKGEIEQALETLQKMAHERSVGAFERMLTAITQDVQPGTRTEIKLNLTTERNMPALDIYSEVAGKPENITSGALANIASTGLRFITLARSGRSRFILLDEPDCFIENGDVQNFFSVIDQLSNDAGIQTVLITHHDVSAFEDRFRVYKVTEVDSDDKWPRRMPELVSQGRMEPSSVQDNYFTFVEAHNFESYTRARIELSPGVTVITGKNGHCKSGWARMLRSALMGESSDSSVRHGQSMSSISVGIDDGRVLTHNRRTKGNPKGEYILHSEESFQYANENPTTWKKDDHAPRPLRHTETARLPEWVTHETNVGPVDGINVALWQQLEPVFMLNEPPSKRASLLSVGRESGHLFSMNEIYKDDLRTDNLAIREGEKELTGIKTMQEALKPLSDLSLVAEHLQEEYVALKRETELLDQCGQLVSDIHRVQAEVDQLHALVQAGSSLQAEPTVDRTEGLTVWLERVAQCHSDVAMRLDVEVPQAPSLMDAEILHQLILGMREAQQAASLMGQVPSMPNMPVLEETEALQRLHQDLKQAMHDSTLPSLNAPHAPEVISTREIDEVINHILDSYQASITPVMESVSAPSLHACDELNNWLEEHHRVQTLMAGARAQNETLSQESKQLDQAIERATEVLGAQWNLPAGRVERLSEELVHSIHKTNGSEKVLCVMDEIQAKLMSAAKEGYAYGLTEGLDRVSDQKSKLSKPLMTKA